MTGPEEKVRCRVSEDGFERLSCEEFCDLVVAISQYILRCENHRQVVPESRLRRLLGRLSTHDLAWIVEQPAGAEGDDRDEQ